MGRKFAGLELLRFLAAVAVLLWHYQHFFYGVPAGDPTRYDVAAQPLYPLLAAAYRHGDFAVQVFWAISGFIFFHRYGAAIHQRRISLGRYLALRFSRLYPLHALTLLLVAALQAAFARGGGATFVYPNNDLRHFALNVLMISQWGLQRGLSFNGPVWSVSVEEFCYLAFFFIASGVAFHRRSLALLAAAGWGLLVTRALAPDFGECLALFLLGGALWGFHGWTTTGGPARRRVLAAAGLLGAAAVAAGWSLYPALPPLAQVTATHVVLVPTILLGFLALSPADGTPGARRCAALGTLTYATYLIHFPVQLAAVTALDALGVSRAVFYSPWALALFLATVLGLGALLFSRFEMPAQAWLRARLLPAAPPLDAPAP